MTITVERVTPILRIRKLKTYRRQREGNRIIRVVGRRLYSGRRLLSSVVAVRRKPKHDAGQFTIRLWRARISLKLMSNGNYRWNATRRSVGRSCGRADIGRLDTPRTFSDGSRNISEMFAGKTTAKSRLYCSVACITVRKSGRYEKMVVFILRRLRDDDNRARTTKHKHDVTRIVTSVIGRESGV